METNLKKVLINVQHSIAPSTMVGYQPAWWLWSSFLQEHVVADTLVSEGIALLFLNKVFSKNFSWSHVNKVFSRVSFLNNLTSLFSFFMVRQALKGYKKSNNVVDYVRRCWVGFARLQKLFAGQSLKYYFLKLYFL